MGGLKWEGGGRGAAGVGVVGGGGERGREEIRGRHGEVGGGKRGRGSGVWLWVRSWWSWEGGVEQVGGAKGGEG